LEQLGAVFGDEVVAVETLAAPEIAKHDSGKEKVSLNEIEVSN